MGEAEPVSAVAEKYVMQDMKETGSETVETELVWQMLDQRI